MGWCGECNVKEKRVGEAHDEYRNVVVRVEICLLLVLVILMERNRNTQIKKSVEQGNRLVFCGIAECAHPGTSSCVLRHIMHVISSCMYEL